MTVADQAPTPPPKWTVPVLGPRLRVSAAFGVLMAAVLAVAVVSGEPSVARLLAGFVAAVVVSDLLHEGAHALAAHRLGYRVEWVVLGALAGVTAYTGRSDRPLDRAAIALAGPAASAGAVLVLLVVRVGAMTAEASTGAIDVLMALSALAFVVNLIPVPGTDGWRVLSGLRDDRRRRRAPAIAGGSE